MVNTLFINGKDAYIEYGIVLAEGAVSALICPAANKSYVSNNSRLENGKRYLAQNVKKDERTLSLPFFIRAGSDLDMFDRLERLNNQVLSKGEFTLRTKYTRGIYHLVYKSCSQMQNFNGRAGKFSMSVIEPDPTNRTA